MLNHQVVTFGTSFHDIDFEYFRLMQPTRLIYFVCFIFIEVKSIIQFLVGNIWCQDKLGEQDGSVILVSISGSPKCWGELFPWGLVSPKCLWLDTKF